MHSVAYLAPALGALLLWRAAAPVESLTMGLTQAAGGFIPMVGLFIVDANVGAKVDWSASGTWLWIGSFAILFITGLGLIWQSRREAASVDRQRPSFT
jgi:ABC-type sugar transport system permease subunit